MLRIADRSEVGWKNPFLEFSTMRSIAEIREARGGKNRDSDLKIFMQLAGEGGARRGGPSGCPAAYPKKVPEKKHSPRKAFLISNIAIWRARQMMACPGRLVLVVVGEWIVVADGGNVGLTTGRARYSPPLMRVCEAVSVSCP